MYVIFPADEVVYLSYGRLIVVPPNSNPENISPIRTNSLPIQSVYSDPSVNSCKSKRDSSNSEPIPEPTTNICNSFVTQPSCSEVQTAQDNTLAKPKKRSLRLNFNLLKRSSSKNSEPTSLSSGVRRSVVPVETTRATTPLTQAFQRDCIIHPREVPRAALQQTLVPEIKKLSKEKEKTNIFYNVANSSNKISSKRSSSSSKTSKPSSFQEDKDSKRSSKHSSSSSKSTKQETSSPVAACNSTSSLKRCQSQVQRETRREPSRNISTPTSLTADVFYPLSTSREKNLVEPSPQPKQKARSNSFRLSFRRSKTPEVPPARPERKKDKKIVKPKPSLDRKLSFSDFLAVSREKSELCPEVRVTCSDREKSPIKREKSPVLSFFRKTPSPKNLGRERTPNVNYGSSHLTSEFLLHEPQIEDISRPSSTGQKQTASDRKLETPKPKGTLSRQRRERV